MVLYATITDVCAWKRSGRNQFPEGIVSPDPSTPRTARCTPGPRRHTARHKTRGETRYKSPALGPYLHQERVSIIPTGPNPEPRNERTCAKVFPPVTAIPSRRKKLSIRRYYHVGRRGNHSFCEFHDCRPKQIPHLYDLRTYEGSPTLGVTEARQITAKPVCIFRWECDASGSP